MLALAALSLSPTRTRHWVVSSNVTFRWAVVAHAFNSSTLETEAETDRYGSQETAGREWFENQHRLEKATFLSPLVILPGMLLSVWLPLECEGRVLAQAG